MRGTYQAPALLVFAFLLVAPVFTPSGKASAVTCATTPECRMAIEKVGESLRGAINNLQNKVLDFIRDAETNINNNIDEMESNLMNKLQEHLELTVQQTDYSTKQTIAATSDLLEAQTAVLQDALKRHATTLAVHANQRDFGEVPITDGEGNVIGTSKGIPDRICDAYQESRGKAVSDLDRIRRQNGFRGRSKAHNAGAENQDVNANVTLASLPETLQTGNGLINQKGISDEAIDKYEAAIVVTTNPDPLPSTPDSVRETPEGREYEATRRSLEEVYTVAQTALAEVLARNARNIPIDMLQDGSLGASREQLKKAIGDDKISFNELMEQRIDSRTGSQDWIDKVRNNRPAAIAKEALLLQADQYALEYERFKQGETQTVLLSYILAELVQQRQNNPDTQQRLAQVLTSADN